MKSVRISMPLEKEQAEQDRDRGQPTDDGADVIPLHVQPRIERILRQSIHGGTINQEVERIQLGVGVGGGIAVQVGARDAALAKFLHTLPSPLAQLVNR